MLISPNRKVLRKDSVPRLALPNDAQLHKSTQTCQLDDDSPKVYSATTASQTPKYLLKDTDPKKKSLLKHEKYGCSERFNPAPDDTECKRFVRLCDQLLSKRLAKRVREYTERTADTTADKKAVKKRSRPTSTSFKETSDEELDSEFNPSDDELLVKYIQNSTKNCHKNSPLCDEALIKVEQSSYREESSEKDPLKLHSETTGDDNQQESLHRSFVKIEVEETLVDIEESQSILVDTIMKVEIEPEEDNNDDDDDE